MKTLLTMSHPDSRKRGAVLVMMALTAVGVFGVVGLTVDVGRMFLAKNETQVYCDSAAVAAALALNGMTTGIDRAENAVEASPNTWNFATTSMSGTSVAFATAPEGPWVASPNPATGYAYVRVTSTVPVRLYFLPLVTGNSTFNLTSAAVAGQVSLSSLSRGLGPYTAVSTDPTPPDFGLVVGNSYDIHWPTFNANRAGCNADHPARCFNSPPCPGDSHASLTAVVDNWGTEYHGYWGSNSNHDIATAVLDSIQLAPVSVGTNLDPLLAPGDKQSEATYLDQRASQDGDTQHNTPDSYLADPHHNGRRLLPVAIANPVDPTHTNAIGFGQFLLLANGSPSDYYRRNTNGNSPYCAIYMGPFNIGSSDPGVGGTTGATSVRLVE